MICLHALIGQCSWIAPSHTSSTITFFPIFSNSTIKSISLFSILLDSKALRELYIYTYFYKIAIDETFNTVTVLYSSRLLSIPWKI